MFSFQNVNSVTVGDRTSVEGWGTELSGKERKDVLLLLFQGAMAGNLEIHSVSVMCTPLCPAACTPS